MRIRNEQTRVFWFACFLLLLVAVFFGFRGHKALNAGSFVAESAADNLRGESDSWMPDTVLLNEKVAYLQGAVAARRDPFSEPPKVKTKPKAASTGTKTTKTEKPKAPKLRPPSLRALLYDTVHPSVKLSWDGKSSEWLHVGDKFQGWRIVDITSRTVIVEKNGTEKTLE